MPPKNASSTVMLAYDGYSDGDSKHRPSGSTWRKCDKEFVERVYLSKVAQKYMEESGQAQAGKAYQLDRLPPGYEVWEKPRNDGRVYDRFCFGHPNHGQGFNSPYDFYPHFKFLMKYDGQGGVCECRFCNPGKSARKAAGPRSSKPTGSVSRPPGIRGRPPLQRGPVDEEGAPDVITRLLAVLQQEGQIDRKIEERSSMDWRVETVIYEGAQHIVASQSSFVPRIGELVLFHRGVDGEVRTDPVTGEVKVWDSVSRSFTSHPEWLGGVVTQVPIPTEPVHLDDITHETPKKHNVNSSGFRVECYPSPNSQDKSFSKQYTYVPMHQIRPMMLCDDILRGIPAEEWHPTVQHAMSAMGSVSCVARYKIRGIWPNFSMFCEGLYLGSEALWAGEALRLMPRGSEKAVIDVIIPESFVVRAYGLEPEPNGTIDANRAKKIHLLVVGQVYTVDRGTSEGHLVEDMSSLPASMHSYGPWYHKSAFDDKYEISFTSILGRLYEYDALQRWFPGIRTSDALSNGMASTRIARAYATRHRDDHSGTNLGWFWGEDRASALDLGTFNGIDVGEYDKERDIKKWREILLVLDGVKDRVVEPVVMVPKATSNNAEEPSASFTPVNVRKSSLAAPPITQDDTEDELAQGMADNEIGIDDYEDVIDGLIAGEGFDEVGESSAGPAAKRARMI